MHSARYFSVHLLSDRFGVMFSRLTASSSRFLVRNRSLWLDMIGSKESAACLSYSSTTEI